jgi:hypothetical protein
VEFQDANHWEIGCHSLDYLERLVPAAIKNYHETEFAVILFLKVRSVIPEHGFNSALFIVRWYQKEQAGLGHPDLLTN